MGAYSKVYPGNMRKVLQVLHTSPTNRIFGGGNLMVVVARAMGHYKETFKRRAYIPFNPKDFSLPGTYLKKERVEAEQHFNYRSRLQPSESGECSDEQTDSDAGADEIAQNTQAGPSQTNPTPPSSPIRDPTPRSPSPIPDPCPIPIPTPPAPRKFFVGRTTLQECAEINTKPIEARPGYIRQPLIDETLTETPPELISDQPVWRRDYMKEVSTFNNYFSVPHNIRTIPEFDPRLLRIREWRREDDLTSLPLNWPIIPSFHLNFTNKKNTLIVFSLFISKFSTSPDPIVRKTVLNLRLLETLFNDKFIDIDNHLEEINFNPNDPLPTGMDTRLYLRACNYGAGAISLFESWQEECFLKGIKPLYRPQAFTNTARAEFIHQFQRQCLNQKRQLRQQQPSKKNR
jgi:hypothetical protein